MNLRCKSTVYGTIKWNIFCLFSPCLNILKPTPLLALSDTVQKQQTDTVVLKYLVEKLPRVIFAVLYGNAALVKGLRRLPFTEESRVRFPYVVRKSLSKFERLFYFPIFVVCEEIKQTYYEHQLDRRFSRPYNKIYCR